MPVYATVTELCKSIQDVAQRGDISGALDMVADFIDHVISRESSIAKVFTSKQIDELCIALGRSWPLKRPLTLDDNRAVFLVTAVHTTGGHSRVLRDIIHALAPLHCTVLISGFRIKSVNINQLFHETAVDVELAPKGNSASRLRWLQKRLFELRPCQTFILQHHHDPLCAAAAQPELTGQLIYFHNCDHSLAIGSHIPHAIHVDFNAKGFYHCRESEGISNNVVWPLVADTKTARHNYPFLVRGHLTTCTCGGFEKFDPSHLIQRIPYVLNYPETLATILKTTSGTHIHIGELHSETILAIHSKLAELGIDRDRLILIPFVHDLPIALINNSVDVYLGSFPRGGGRATVEAMGVGMPLVIYSNYRSIFFTDACEVYPGSLIWRTEEELVRHLKTMSSVDQLQKQSRVSRAFFLSRHTPAALAASIKATLSGVSSSPPERPEYTADALQSFLDEMGATTVIKPADHIRTRELLRLISKYLKRKTRSLFRFG